jgi:hypothetical protein
MKRTPMPTYGCTRTGKPALSLSQYHRRSRRRVVGTLNSIASKHVAEPVAAALASISVQRCLY